MKRLFLFVLLAFPIVTQAQNLSTTTFAAGCFWCSEEAFEKVPGIFWHDEEQRRLAEASKTKYDKLKTSKQPIVTPIVKATQFWPAEDYHQDYYKKNPLRYKVYPTGCGRYARLDELWGKLRK